MKLICAFLICMIHVFPFNATAMGVDSLHYVNFLSKQYIARIAVPFYFTASGFLLFRKVDFQDLNTDRIRDYCLKILRLMGIWIFVLFAGSTGHLWYLSASVLAVIVLSFMIKKKVHLRYMVILSLILFAIGLLGDSYYSFLEPLKDVPVARELIAGYETVFSTTRNGLFFGFIFILLGAIFAHRRIVLNGKIALAGLILSLTAMFFEVNWLRDYSHPKDYNMLVSLLPVTFFLFYLASHLNLRNRPIYARLRTVGTLIFFSQMLVRFFVDYAIKIVKKRWGTDLSVYRFVLFITLTVALAILIERLSHRERLKWLRYLCS